MSRNSGIICAIKYGHMASPALTIEVDRDIFRKTNSEREKIETAKLQFRERLKATGGKWKPSMKEKYTF